MNIVDKFMFAVGALFFLVVVGMPLGLLFSGSLKLPDKAIESPASLRRQVVVYTATFIVFSAFSCLTLLATVFLRKKMGHWSPPLVFLAANVVITLIFAGIGLSGRRTAFRRLNDIERQPQS